MDLLRTRSFLALLALPLALAGALLWRLATHRHDPPRAEPARADPARPPAPRDARGVLPIRAVAVQAPRTTSIVVANSPGAFEGSVVSAASGEGVPRAEVSFARGAEVARVVTDATGHFRFQPTTVGRWTLRSASAPGFLPLAPDWGHAPVLLDARRGAHVRNVLVPLAPEVRYRVTVLDPSGSPVQGAEVTVLGGGAGEAAVVPLERPYVTGRGGEVEIVAPEGAVVEASAAGWSPGRAAVGLPAVISGGLSVRLGRAPLPAQRLVLAGRTSLPDGRPAAGALVVAWPRWPDPRARPRHAVVGPAGDFRIEEVEGGTWDLVVRTAGFAPTRLLDVRAGAPPVELRLAEGGRVVGRVVERGTGRPVVPATILVRPGPSGLAEPLGALAVVDADGRFELEDLPLGPVFLVAAAPGHAPAGPLEVQAAPPGAPPAWVELEVPPGERIAGLVRCRASGEAMAEVEVTLEADPSPSSPVSGLRTSVTTSPDGAFALAGAPDRPATLRLLARGHHALVVPVPPTARGDRGELLVLDLAPVGPGERPLVERSGIGAVLAPHQALLYVQEVAPGGGAAEAGLAAGDVVVSVDGRQVAGLAEEEVAPLLHGPEGSSVVLEVWRAGDRSRIERLVVRRRIVRG